jgi:hypothetical protein
LAFRLYALVTIDKNIEVDILNADEISLLEGFRALSHDEKISILERVSTIVEREHQEHSRNFITSKEKGEARQKNTKSPPNPKVSDAEITVEITPRLSRSSAG